MSNSSLEIYNQSLKMYNNPDLANKKAFNKNFCYYSTISGVNNILNSKKIYIHNLSTMNDLKESELHKNDKEFIYLLCLCNTNSEKIPMWYLYGGISGDGACIIFTPGIIRKFIQSIKTVTGFNKGKMYKLIKDKDFNMEYGWVFYSRGDRRYKYKNKNYEVYYDTEFQKNNYFIKDYAWEYEKEFRIVIKTNTGIEYERLEIEIPEEIYSKIKIKLGPETKYPFEKIFEKEGFKNFLETKLEKSKLSVKMDMFNRNHRNMIDYISNEIKSGSDRSKIDDICKAIKKGDYCKSDKNLTSAEAAAAKEWE